MPNGPPPISVSAAELSRSFGAWQDRATHNKVVVTHHGRPRVVLLPVGDFEQLVAGRASDPNPEQAVESARFTVLGEHISGGFITLDKSLRFTFVNAEASIYFGKPVGALLGKTPTEAKLGNPEGPVAAVLHRVADGGAETVFDAPSNIYPGRVLRLRVFPFPGGVAAVLRNVAHEIQIEHDEREREALFAARDAHGGIASARLSVRGTFELPDPSLARLAGLPIERLRGLRLTDLLVTSMRGAAGEVLEEVLSGSGARQFASRMLVHGSDDIEVCIALAPVREGYGVTGAMMMLTT